MRCHADRLLTLAFFFLASAIFDNMLLVIDALPAPSSSGGSSAKIRPFPSQNEVDKTSTNLRFNHHYSSGHKPLASPPTVVESSTTKLVSNVGNQGGGADSTSRRCSSAGRSFDLVESGCTCSSYPLVVRCRGLGASSALREVVSGFRSQNPVVLDELQLTDVDAVVDVLRRQRTPRQDVGLDGLRVRRLMLACSGATRDDDDDSGGDDGESDDSADEEDPGLDALALAAGLVSTADLTELTTTGCRMRHDSTMPDGSSLLTGYPGLRVLRLRFAGLDSLPFSTGPSWMLTDTTTSGLQELQLWGNKIASLDDWVFHGLPSLARLDLDRNRLTTIRRRMWTGLISLQSLKLSRNQLSTLPDSVFTDLHQLRALSVDRNLLSFLHPAALFGLYSLVVLRLSDNRIQFFADGAFSQLPSLRRLDLSGNRLDRIWAGTFAGLQSLEWIDLSRNRLSRVPDGSFRHSAGLSRIQLDWNRMSTGLSRCALASSRPLQRLRSISMLGNQVTCGNDCSSAWLARTATSTRRRKSPADGDTGKWLATAWSATTVWGNCLTNNSDGTLTVESIGNPSIYGPQWCSHVTTARDCED
jgi:hypothetical protein